MADHSDGAGYLETVGYSFLVVSPVLLCFCFPAQKYIGRFQKELLAASFGTICGFTFFEIIPRIINDAHAHILTDQPGVAPEDRNVKPQIWLLSCTIFIGMLFAAMLGALHEVMEHKHCDESSDPNSKDGSKACLSCM